MEITSGAALFPVRRRLDAGCSSIIVGAEPDHPLGLSLVHTHALDGQSTKGLVRRYYSLSHVAIAGRKILSVPHIFCIPHTGMIPLFNLENR